MVKSKYRGGESPLRPGDEKNSPPVEGGARGKTNGPPFDPPSAKSSAAESKSPDSSSRGIKPEVRKRLSIIRGSTSLGTELRLREHLRRTALKDVLDFLKTLMDAGGEDPKNLGHLGFEAAKLILDKLTGFPQAPYDEQEAMGVAILEGSTVKEEADRVMRTLQSQPLEQYLDIARRGALPAPGQTHGPDRPE